LLATILRYWFPSKIRPLQERLFPRYSRHL